ncbi:MAG: hypothetical protein UV79_C0010G0013 [candidate division TM6 bacterium GW2011_GWF2_43_17]|nr:MAG: hypothetical protein UV79_C0010G0013 [candidate division TM6 bacterium GW2011_GWF2_43_17]
MQDSNLRPPVCKTDALPAELIALTVFFNIAIIEYRWAKVKGKDGKFH